MMGPRRPWFVLLLLLLAAAACGPLAGQPGPTTAAPVATTSAAPTVTPSRTPALAVAATTVAAPAEATTTTPQPGAPCVIVVRTPRPSAPTETGGQQTPPRQIDPHLELCASATSVKVGDRLTLVAQVVDLGLPNYAVFAQDAQAAERAVLVMVTYENRVTGRDDVSKVLELVDVQATGNSLVATLRARAFGRVRLSVDASGEVHYGYPGPAGWSGGRSEPLTITVTQ